MECSLNATLDPQVLYHDHRMRGLRPRLLTLVRVIVEMGTITVSIKMKDGLPHDVMLHSRQY